MSKNNGAARSALIVWGGWDGHQPKEVAEIFASELQTRGFEVEVSDTLDAFLNADKLKALDLIVPVWTMGTITGEQLNPVLEAVKGGVGIAGCHGGMCDSFRNETEWQFMTGGQWISHPGNDGTEYTVRITDTNHFITQGSPAEFAVKSEQYYLHTDPSNHVLGVTQFPVADGPHVKNGPFDMPQIWTRYYGEGRVSYNALGHQANIVTQREVLPLMVRGLLWAAHAEEAL
ncbi:MAG: ThuA domain-containing protein [Capsulimonas sp.]|uniref:ThuA domain-containing protein n=1 Tax=Capsulimonas sp. TaxID=2494211 RepID=UPI00326510BB